MNKRVTIGIPIYYGEIFLEETLKSIFAQTFKDFDIVITDNYPGGIAQEIAEKYAENKENVYYYKHDKNIGALENWNSIIQYVDSEYFIYAGGHDLWPQDFLGTMVDLLDKRQNAVLAYAPTQIIDKNGNRIDKYMGFVDTSGCSVLRRFNIVFWSGQEPLYGLMRTSVIKKTRLQKRIVGSGAVWLGELSIFGEFVVAHGLYRYRRENRIESGREEQMCRYHKTLFKKKRIRIIPHLRVPLAYIFAIFRGKMNIYTRFLLLISVVFNSLIRYNYSIALDLLSLIKRLPKFKIY